ncbi:coat protein [ssRNA phage SRR7976357_9]|uniref:Coat protein n=1 Tax=ssRNA phage SRR7976357_9 TaxID=2786749 RepID=A0A8S5L1E7_9VIRU|nr:coat protein [ssRNA phage SRR7976357_9]DAD51252.1 TPA_asm: coat protein [ssRNA phage SRR7976357_9]
MPTQSAITLNTKVYNPRGKQGNIATWALVGDATFGGATSTLSSSVVVSKDFNTRVQLKLTVPKAAASDTACGCAGTITSRGYGDVVVQVPANFTVAEKQDLCDRLQAAVANAIFDAACLGEGSW